MAKAPKANAGGNKKITLPTNKVTLAGSGTNGSGSITTYKWIKIAGPDEYALTTPTQAQTAVQNLSEGVYEFELTVIDNLGMSGKDTAWITVKAVALPNKAPVADAGEDINITLPANSAILSGSATDSDGTIMSFQWREISGPAGFTMTSVTDARVNVTELTAGEYEFELSVKDNFGAVGRDTVKVLVNEKFTSTAKVYPNPATNQVNIQITSAVKTETTGLRIYDARGQMVYQETFANGQQTMVKQVPVDNLPKGIYYIELNVDANKLKTLMFAKQYHDR